MTILYSVWMRESPGEWVRVSSESTDKTIVEELCLMFSRCEADHMYMVCQRSVPNPEASHEAKL